MEVGRKIARARKYQTPAMAHKDLAQAMSVALGTVGKWESGSQGTPHDQVVRIARLLSIPVDWFYDGKDTPPPRMTPESPVEVLSPDEGQAAFKTKYDLSDTVAVPVWQGVLAGEDGECTFAEGGELQEIPRIFFAGNDPEQCFAIRAAGSSMSPRIEHGELALILKNARPHLNTIVVATKPDQTHFIKVLRSGKPPRPYKLEPLNEAYTPIEDVTGWTFEGVVILIQGDPGMPGRNVEWNLGAPLRA